MLNHARAMIGPFLGLVKPSTSYRLARALKFSTLSLPFWKGHVDEFSIFGTIPGPCSDYIGSIFSVALFLS